MDLFTTTSELTGRDRREHLQARLGYRRMDHRVEPGLYRLGAPNAGSPVFVSANYSLSFDALRTALKGIDGYILVLDTKGVNVWCAAGKGTFGTEELVRRIEDTGLAGVVEHRTLILPQLGAPGVAGHEVRKRTGFKVEFGPVRAADIPEYLRLGKATPEMRRVTFPLRDRAVLIPVEIKTAAPYLIVVAVLLFLIGGPLPALIAIIAVLGGTALFPILLPWLPTRDFSSKGLVLGAVLAVPFALWSVAAGGEAGWVLVLYAVSMILLVSPVVAYFALNFTGCSTYTSRTGVKKEIFRWVPKMAAMAIVGVVALAVSAGSSMGWY